MLERAAEAAGDPSLGQLAQYGVLGLFTILLIIVVRALYQERSTSAQASWQREVERGDRLEQEVARLNDLIINRMIPALSSQASVVEEATELMRAMQRERELTLYREREISDRRPTGGQA